MRYDPHKITVMHEPTSFDRDSKWRVWVPPTGPECYEGGDVPDGALLGPWGDSFWPSWEAAIDFAAACIRIGAVA